MEKVSYKKHRGYHHHICQFCGIKQKERIPDQASDDYQHNPGNPLLGLCVNCNHGVGAGGIRLLPHSLSVGQKGIDSDNETSLDLSKRISDLPIDWQSYARIALKFKGKAKEEDRADLVGDIILRIAEVARKRKAQGEVLTEGGMVRVASYTVLEYWSNQKEITTGVNCGNCSKVQRARCKENDLYSQCPKLIEIVSLNQEIEDGQGNTIELWETIADDNATDLEAWVDTTVLLSGFPKRLIEVVNKKVSGEVLSQIDRNYLYRARARKFSQLSFF